MFRPLVVSDFAQFMELRGRALESDSAAFQNTLQEWRMQAMAEHERRFRATVTGVDSFMLGAFAVGEAEDDTAEGALVAMLGFRRMQGVRVRHKGLIWGVYVAPEQRGRGLGGDLLDEAIRIAQDLDDLQQIQLTVIAENPPALRLYESRGFVRFGREKAAVLIHGRPHDELHMQLFL